MRRLTICELVRKGDIVDALGSPMPLKTPHRLSLLDAASAEIETRLMRGQRSQPIFSCPQPKVREQARNSSDVLTYEITVHSEKIVLLQADTVIEQYGRLVFRRKGINVGRFPAATTTYRELESVQPQP